MRKHLVVIGMVAMFGAVAQTAQAASLVFGSISISGAYIPVNVGSCGTQLSCQGAMTTLGQATGIDFVVTNGVTSPGTAGDYRVGGTTGDFTTAGIISGVNGEMGKIKDISLTGSNVNGFSAAPILLFQLNNSGNFSFDLLNFTFVQTTNQLDIFGFGTIKLAGYLDTPGTFYFSNQGTGVGTFTFSATEAAVPEPSSMLLMGFGLVGLAAVLRRRRQARKMA